MKHLTKLAHWAYRTSLVVLMLLGSTELQAQFDNTATGDVNLNDPGWVKVNETFEVLNNDTGTDRFEHWGKFDTTGSMTDLVIVLIRNALGNGLSLPGSNQFNYDLIAPNPQITYIDGTIVDGSRVTLPATTAPLELSRITFAYGGGGGSNWFVFSNSALGNGGNPSNVASIWNGKISYHTDEDNDVFNSTRNPSTETVQWIPGTTTPASAVDVGTIDSSWDTNANGELSYAEWQAGIAALGYININNIYPTTQTHGDHFAFNVSDADIVTTPLADTEIIPAGDFNLYVTLLDTSGKEISSGYGAWVTGTVPTLSVDSYTLDTQLVLYPNPTSDYFTVSLAGQEIDRSSITICDMTGRIVARHTTDVSGLSSGMYLVHIATDTDRSNTIRLIKR